MVSVCAFLAFSLRTDCYPSECTLPFPRSYVVYHLNEHEAIDVDGKLDDEAWDSVSWTEDFIGECLARGLGNGHVGAAVEVNHLDYKWSTRLGHINGLCITCQLFLSQRREVFIRRV